MFLIRITLIALISFLITISAALLIAHQQPADSLLLDFSRCENRICVLGIAPSVTTYADATAILDSSLQFERTPANIVIADKRTEPYYQIVLYKGVTMATVIEIDLLFNRLRVLTVSQIVAKFGIPCSVIPRYVPENMLLIYPGMTVYLEADPFTNSRPLTFSSRIAQINLLDNNLHDCTPITFSEGIVPWRGFRFY